MERDHSILFEIYFYVNIYKHHTNATYSISVLVEMVLTNGSLIRIIINLKSLGA